MLIYQMTHMPTGKRYIGSLKDDSRWEKYCTSSNTVKPMMKSNPTEWTKEILLKDFCNDVSWSDVVGLEQALIDTLAKIDGWNTLFNGGVYRGQIKLAAQTKPVRPFPKGNIPWNKGKTGLQSMPEDHPWKIKTTSWNKGVKMSPEQTKNMGGKRLTSEEYSILSSNRPVYTCQHCLKQVKGKGNLKQHLRSKHNAENKYNTNSVIT
jgi:hypothetical protein